MLKTVLEYWANNDQCWRDVLFCDMDEYHHVDKGSKCLCCDICAQSCKCGSCSENHKSFMFLYTHCYMYIQVEYNNANILVSMISSCIWCVGSLSIIQVKSSFLLFAREAGCGWRKRELCFLPGTVLNTLNFTSSLTIMFLSLQTCHVVGSRNQCHIIFMVKLLKNWSKSSKSSAQRNCQRANFWQMT